MPVDRDRVGHAARVPLDDGIGRVKISIPPFSGSGSPEDFLEWEMRLDHIFPPTITLRRGSFNSQLLSSLVMF